jgi:hypothetical protein
LKDGVKLVPSDRILVEIKENLYSLAIKQVTCQDAGQYSVKATNSVGSANASATLAGKT